MIRLTVNDEGSLNVIQHCVPPTVYLDHWAWRKISESGVLTKRFSSALKSRNGTLAFSWINIIEFNKVDPKQAQKADILLNEIWPEVFVLYPNFFKVIEQEHKNLTEGHAVAPHADLETLKAILKLKAMDPKSLHPLPTPKLFAHVPSTGISSDEFADQVIGHIESLRHDYSNDRGFFSAANRKPTVGQIECGTRFIARELLMSFLKDKRLRITRNHAVDLSHAVVAVSYCDYVLLDAHWATQVEIASKRLSDWGMFFPMARVFSESGLEKFFHELESGARQTHSA